MCLTQANKGLYLYANAFGIPNEISYPLIEVFTSMCRNNGLEYTCERFKAMKIALIREKSGMSFSIPWMKKRNSRTFSGPFGSLQNWCRKSIKRWSKAIKLLQIYTTLYSDEVTSKQEEKFLNGVNSDPVIIPEELSNALCYAVRRLRLKHNRLKNPPNLWRIPVSPTKRAPHPNGKTYPENSCLLESLSYTRKTSFGLSLRGRYSRIFDIVEEDIEFCDDRDVPDIIDFPNSVGKISFIQEPGFKLRAVANPGRVYQAALQPLGKALYSKLATLPWDCTHDQSKGIIPIQEKLSHEAFVYSIDLSGATDYFPLDLQLTVLYEMFPNDQDYVSLFRDLSRGPWIYKKSFIRWRKGQPLGLYPSFASFALTHGLLLYALNNFEHNNSFYVLGDDVVILDETLYSQYIATLRILGCPISDVKSLTSNKVAEFAGKLITSKSTIIQNKWRSLNDDSFIDLLRNIGQKGIYLLKTRQRRVAKLLWSVPEFLGGLGFNPQGKPLSDRIFDYLMISGEKELSCYLMSLNKKINIMNYYDRELFSKHGYFITHACDFDQKSKTYIHLYLPILKAWWDISGKNLFSIDPDLDLLIEETSSSRTLLERLENVFGIR
jgi:hypothetical protein